MAPAADGSGGSQSVQTKTEGTIEFRVPLAVYSQWSVRMNTYV